MSKYPDPKCNFNKCTKKPKPYRYGNDIWWFCDEHFENFKKILTEEDKEHFVPPQHRKNFYKT